MTNAMGIPEIVIQGGTSISGQIKEQIKGAIAAGELIAGEPLPSVREMAVALAINPDCVRRAYSELEQEGFVNTAEGTGIFVAESAFIKNEEDADSRTELAILCIDLLARAQRRGFDSNDVVEMIETVARGGMSS
jgi:GntR family transcriptional regulator